MEAGFAGSQSDPGGEGFAEESMWQMGVSGGQEMYPERSDEANCKYYLRTGVCGYGSRCRFNHPPDRSAVVGAMRLGRGEYPQRVGQPVCKYYMMTGTCKFGLSCKYHHPRQGGGTHVSLNYLGYPLRPGEKECAYYVKTGQCKFGVTCKFHHPQPVDIPVTTASPAQGISPVPAPVMYAPSLQPPSAAQAYGVVPSNWQVARQPTLIPYPYMQGPYTPMVFPHGMVPLPGWAPFPAHVSSSSPTPQPTLGSNPPYGISQLSSSAAEYTGPFSSVSLSGGPSSGRSSQKDRGLPERPGQPECQYYIKTGDCKYGSSCRYHHPPEFFRPKTSEPANLPIRPGAPTCIYYAQYGVCKYGSACKYDHTSRAGISYSSSTSSLTDAPLAPLPLGSSTGTLAASSSSSDLHQELAIVSGKDSSPTPIISTSPTASTASQHSTVITGSKDAPTDKVLPSIGKS